MAISGANVASVFSTDDTLSAYSTGSYTPTADRLLIAYVDNSKSGTPETPTLSGNGLTWSQVATNLPDIAGTWLRTTLFVAKTGSSPSAGAVTADFGGVTQLGCTIIVDQFDGADLIGTALQAIVQSKTSPSSAGSGTSETITLDNAIGSGNATYGAFQHQNTENTTPGAGYTELLDNHRSSPTNRSMTEYRADGQVVVDASWTTSIQRGGIATEIKLAVAGPVAKPGTDELIVGVTDVSEIQATLAVSDSFTVGVTDASAIQAVLTASDSLTVGITDTAQVEDVTAAGAFTLRKSIGGSTLRGGDTLRGAEGAEAPIAITASDSLTVGITDAVSAIQARLDVADSLVVGVTDSVSSTLASLSASDSLSVALTEAVAIDAALSATDSLLVGVTDAGAVQAALSASDTLTVGVSDTSAIRAALSAADTLTISITDAGSVSVGDAVEKAASDTLSVGITEATSISVNVTASDSLGIGLSEAVAIQAIVSAQDSLNVSLTDTASLLALVTASDTLVIGFTDTQAILVSLTAQDTLTIGVTDLADLRAVIAVADTLGVSLLEAVTILTSEADPVPLNLTGVHSPESELVGRHTPDADLTGKHTPDTDLVGSSGLP